MIGLRRLFRDASGASAAEFALVLPLLLLLIFGTIDVGRYAWSLNQAEKATQTGARWAVVTNVIASFYSYSFAVTGGIPQGTTVPLANFPTITCQTVSGTPVCSCAGNLSFCAIDPTNGTTAFNGLATRMAQIYPGLTANNIVVTYTWSGLGFAGDPNGPDVAPLTTVSLRNVQFAPFSSFIFGGPLTLPSFAYTLPMEDGSGTASN